MTNILANYLDRTTPAWREYCIIGASAAIAVITAPFIIMDDVYRTAVKGERFDMNARQTKPSKLEVPEIH